MEEEIRLLEELEDRICKKIVKLGVSNVDERQKYVMKIARGLTRELQEIEEEFRAQLIPPGTV